MAWGHWTHNLGFIMAFTNRKKVLVKTVDKTLQYFTYIFEANSYNWLGVFYFVDITRNQFLKILFGFSVTHYMI